MSRAIVINRFDKFTRQYSSFANYKIRYYRRNQSNSSFKRVLFVALNTDSSQCFNRISCIKIKPYRIFNNSWSRKSQFYIIIEILLLYVVAFSHQSVNFRFFVWTTGIDNTKIGRVSVIITPWV